MKKRNIKKVIKAIKVTRSKVKKSKPSKSTRTGKYIKDCTNESNREE